jgi:GT2 family glycosyltransferase
LNEAERDFVVARVRQRGWFNLFVGPHHPPRGVQNERYPAKRLSVESLPRFTIVTPSFHQGAFLEQTMMSVLGQRDVRIDYVVQDGGSTDGSVDIIKRYAERLAHWQSLPDAGQADAVVRGFAGTTQRPEDVMAYLNSDDVLLDGAGHFVAQYFARHPEIDVVYGHRIFIDAEGREVGRWFTPRTPVADIRLHNFVPQETLFWRRRIWDRVGGIDRSLNFALDWDLLLRFAAAGATIARLPWFLAAFRLHTGQKTSTSLQQTGIPEMDRLRQRTLGRPAEHEELHLAMRQGELDSALIFALWQQGWRI